MYCLGGLVGFLTLLLSRLICCVKLRFILIETDFNEGRGRGELLSPSNFVSSLLSVQQLAATEHS